MQNYKEKINLNEYYRRVSNMLHESEETGEIIDLTNDEYLNEAVNRLVESPRERLEDGPSGESSRAVCDSLGVRFGSVGRNGKPKRQRGRGYCFTINNYSVEEERVLQRIAGEVDLRTNADFSYIVFGKEIGDSGTPHLQGYVHCHNPRDLSSIKRIIGQRAHLEIAKGTAAQNREYCTKDGEFTECGEMPKAGHRSDLEGVVNSVKNKASLIDLCEAHPIEMIKFQKGILGFRSLLMKPRMEKTKVMWFWGPTGTGKSREAFRIAKTYQSFYYKCPASKWWDGYDQQDVVIVDDYRPDFSTFAALLRLLDRYPERVEYKGGMIDFNSKLIIITSPKDPENTWSNRSAEDIQQLLRRIEEIRFFDLPNDITILN